MPANKTITDAFPWISKDPSKILSLSFNGQPVEKPGIFIPKGDAKSEPEVAFTLPKPYGTYIVICVDLDAPFPSFNVIPALHWIQHGLKAENPGDNLMKLTTSEPFVADYAGPGPPPISAPHRYCFFLYEQPAGFDYKKYAMPNGAPYPISKRMRFSLDNWAKEANLGPLLAFNYFTSK